MVDGARWVSTVVDRLGGDAVLAAKEVTFRDAPKSMRQGLFVVTDKQLVFFRKKAIGEEFLVVERMRVSGAVATRDELSVLLGDSAVIDVSLDDGRVWRLGPLEVADLNMFGVALGVDEVDPGVVAGDAPAEGWWIASDGKWYPPELHPDAPVTTAQTVPSDGPAALAVPDVDGVWAGRTTYSGTAADLALRVAAAEHDHSTMLSGSHLVGWVEGIDLTMERPAFRPIDPKRVSPLPMAFALPAVKNGCPVPALAPWWDAVVLPTERGMPVAEAPLGARLLIAAAYPGHKRVYERISRLGDDVSGHIEVMADRLIFWGQGRLSRERVSGPGFVGSFVPLYSEGRSLVSAASTESSTFTYGCQVPFDAVTALAVAVTHQTAAPLIGGKDKKALYAERGYGPVVRWQLQVTITDGWRSIYLSIESPVTFRISDDEAAVAFLDWIAKYVAYHRSSELDLSPQDRARMEAIADGSEGLAFSDTTDSKHTIRSWTLQFPSPRPISVAVNL